MTTPSFDNIFQLYYTLYRAEKTVPISTDDEYVLAMRFANEAIARWSHYDGTYWKELFTTVVAEGEGTVISTGVTDYDAPENFREAGGFIKILDANGNTIRNYPIIEPQDAQFRGDQSPYAFFTGDPGNGATLHLNPSPDAALNGLRINYVYYKKPTEFTAGGDETECPNTEYICHRMLAMRYRASRNPYYQDAMNDAEDALKTMQMDNNSGSWADPWKLADNSGAQFGAESGGSFF